ncbi:MAG: hypothetical protein ABMA14_04205 [Hyphomonadaceae bacterium]
MAYQQYPVLSVGTASAQIHMQRKAGEPTSPPSSPDHWFFVYDNAECDENDKSGFLAPVGWDVGNEADRAIAAGSPVYLRINTRYLGSGNATSLYSRVECTSVARFTPRAGASYVAYHDTFSSTCPAIVIDKATGKAPDDFQLVPIEGLCQKFNT